MLKIYILTDLEGITGIDTYEMIQRDSGRYRECCELLTGDVNAAVEGAFAGGADHVAVLDGHGGGGNLIVDMLDPRAENDTGIKNQYCGIMNESYQGTFSIGAHAMAGTINGFLDHTQSSVEWHDYSVNGRRMGELAQWAIAAGSFGIPMLMVSGDEAACVEARQFFSPLETAVVKRGIGRNRAELVPPDEARARIREAARRAIGLVGRARPFIPTLPMEIVLEFNRSDFCDNVARSPGVERLDARTVRKVTSDPLALFPW